MKKKYFFILFIISLIAILFIFHNTKGTDNEKISNNEFDSEKILNFEENKDNKMIFDLYNQRLVIYNNKTYETKRSNIVNYLQYSFNEKSRFYTTGHSIENNFEIIEVNSDSIKSIYRANENEAIFPLATNNKMTFFLMVTYDNDGNQIETNIVEMDKNYNLHECVKSNENISSGVIVNNNLYYTIYNSSKDNFKMYMYNTKTKNIVLIDENLESDNIYQYNDKLYISDDKYIYNYNNKNEKYKKHFYNYFNNENNILIQYRLDSLGGVILDLYSLKDDYKLIKSFNEVIDFEIKENILIVYSYNGVYKFNI